MSELNYLTIKEAKEGLRAKKFSALELTKACLLQIQKVDSKLNAFITVSEKYALDKAKEADKKLATGTDLPLLGIPIALKDLYSTKGIKTTAGAKLLDNYFPFYSATVVEKLEAAGAIIIGKTNCDAWAHGSSGENSDYGATLNPWNLTKIPGGSSSGSAVAVSASMAFFSMGSDTGGSIRLPASFTNTVGLKPTYGRVSRFGVIAMASSLDSMGHFTKTVYDNALVLSVTSGKDLKDATSLSFPVPNYEKMLQKKWGKLKIGIPKEYFDKGLDEEIKNKVLAAVNFFKLQKHEIIEVTLPYTEAALSVYYIIMSAEVSSNLARFDGIRFGQNREKFSDEAKRRIMLGTYTLSSGYYDAYYLTATKVRSLVKQDFEKVFKDVDLIIGPVSPTLPFNLGEKVEDPLSMYLGDVLTVPINLAGLPALTVPCGFSQSGLPIGMQIIGPQLSEELIYNLGYHYQQNTDWHKRNPNL